jgi:purine-nucleoside phosphorylase
MAFLFRFAWLAGKTEIEKEKPMKVIVNFGNPRKDMITVADAILGSYSREDLKITGVEIYQKNNLILTSAAYGAGMTLDLLHELKNEGLLERGNAVIFVGSMGSFNEEEISLGDVVIPNPSGCAYYGFDGLWLHQDANMLASVEKALAESGKAYREYKHGSSFAVFDPHTDHQTYTSSLYPNDVIGVDCGEVFLGLHFAKINEMQAAAMLYCSDSPTTHIEDIGTDEFNKRATKTDILLNGIAASVLRSLPE